MRSPAWLGSMASRGFLVLLVGIVAAASLAFTVADLQRREDERRARAQRTVDRVTDTAGFLNSIPRDLWPTVIGRGPEAPRWPVAGTEPGPADAELTQRLAVRLGAGARVVASRPPKSACGPTPPPPPTDTERPAPPPLELRPGRPPPRPPPAC